GGGPSLADNDVFGISETSLGDLNSYGIVDFAVGASADSSLGSTRGAVYVLFMASQPVLNLSFVPGTISENGGTSTATISRLGGDNSQSLVVDVSSSDTTEASVPASV